MASNSAVNINIRTVTQEGIVHCNHGVPAARRTASTAQNSGRVFWCCMRHSDDEDRCRFFKWDDQLPPHQNGAASSTNNHGPAPPPSQQARHSTAQVVPPFLPQQIATPQQSPRSSSKRHNPPSPTPSPSHSARQAPSSPMLPPSPQKTPHRKPTSRQSLTPAQRETMLAAIHAARATPGDVSHVAPAAPAASSMTPQSKVDGLGSPTKNFTPSRLQTSTTNNNRIPAPDFSPATKSPAGIRTPAPPAFRLKQLTTGIVPAVRATVAPNPASVARRKAIEDAMRNGPPPSNVGPSAANRSTSRISTSPSKVDGGVQTERDPMYYDDDDEEMRPMPGRLDFDSQPRGAAGPSNGRVGGTDVGEEVEMTEEGRFFSSPTVTQGQVMTPPSSTLKPRLGREMVNEDQDEEEEEEGDDDVKMEVGTGMEMDEDEDEDQKPMMGMDANLYNGKGKERERQRQSESMVREALEGFNWDEFEASTSSVNSYRPQTPPRDTSASAPPFPSQQSQFSHQSYSRRTSRDTPTNPNSAEMRTMIDALQTIPQAMQNLERQKAELERTGEAQQRRIEYLEAEVDSLKQKKENIEDSFRQYMLLHG